METAKINTDNEWITVVDKKKVKKDKRRMKKKLLKEQQNKKQNNRNKSYYDNSKKLYQKNIKPEIKTIQDAPETETTDKKTGIAIMTNVFSNLLNEFDESSE
jgi:CHAT domain-containing protein